MPWRRCLESAAHWLSLSYPNEGCGLIVYGPAGFRFLPCQNLADTPRVRYALDPLEFVRAEDRGEQVVAIVHSHVDTGDGFSAEDINGALLGQPDALGAQQPAYPGVDYVVVSVRDRVADHASVYRFEPDALRSFRLIDETELAP